MDQISLRQTTYLSQETIVPSGILLTFQRKDEWQMKPNGKVRVVAHSERYSQLTTWRESHGGSLTGASEELLTGQTLSRVLLTLGNLRNRCDADFRKIIAAFSFLI
jgi:hypothetical protein